MGKINIKTTIGSRGATYRSIKCKKCGVYIRQRSEDGNFGDFKCKKCGSEVGVVMNTFRGE